MKKYTSMSKLTQLIAISAFSFLLSLPASAETKCDEGNCACSESGVPSGDCEEDVKDFDKATYCDKKQAQCECKYQNGKYKPVCHNS